MTKTFLSKRGVVELNRENIPYAFETYFYQAGKLLQDFWTIRPKSSHALMLSTYLGSGITDDMYIPAILLHYFNRLDSEQEVKIAVSYDNKNFSVGPNKPSDLIVALDKLFDNGIFTTYRGISGMHTVKYDNMSDTYFIGALRQRVTNLNLLYRNQSVSKMLDVINSVFPFHLYMIENFDKTCYDIYNYLIKESNND